MLYSTVYIMTRKRNRAPIYLQFLQSSWIIWYINADLTIRSSFYGKQFFLWKTNFSMTIHTPVSCIIMVTTINFSTFFHPVRTTTKWSKLRFTTFNEYGHVYWDQNRRTLFWISQKVYIIIGSVFCNMIQTYWATFTIRPDSLPRSEQL